MKFLWVIYGLVVASLLGFYEPALSMFCLVIYLVLVLVTIKEMEGDNE